MEPTNCINIPPNALQPCHSFALLRLTFSVVYDASLIFPVLLSFTPGSTRSYQPSNTKPTVTKYIKIMQNLLLDHRSHHHTPPGLRPVKMLIVRFPRGLARHKAHVHMGMAIFGGWTSTWSIPIPMCFVTICIKHQPGYQKERWFLRSLGQPVRVPQLAKNTSVAWASEIFGGQRGFLLRFFVAF